MKDEIKEILDKLKSDDYYEKEYQKSVYYERDLKKLEDCITNLQEELEEEKRIEQASLDTINNLQEELKSANESITWWQNRFNALQEELERLKQKLEKNTKIYLNTSKYASEMEGKYILEKYKNEKAIEYIKKRCYIESTNEWFEFGDDLIPEYIVNILNGDDNE